MTFPSPRPGTQGDAALVGTWSGDLIPSGSILDFSLAVYLRQDRLYGRVTVDGSCGREAPLLCGSEGTLLFVCRLKSSTVHFKGQLLDGGVLRGSFEAHREGRVVELGRWRLWLRREPMASSAALTLTANLGGLVRRWEVLMRQNHVPGMAVAAIHYGDVLLLEGLGQRDPDRHLPVTLDTSFYIASATKPFVAIAVVLLAEWGEIDLDASVQTYLPRFRVAVEDTNPPVTVRDLLCHRNGIVSDEIDYHEAYVGDISDDRFYDLLSRVRPLQHFEYRNLHYTLLGRVLAATTNDNWMQVVKTKIFEPAGMYATTTSMSAHDVGTELAVPFEEIDGELRASPVRKMDRTMHAGGGVVSTVRDLARWLQVNVAEGTLDNRRVFPAAVIGQMTREATTATSTFYEFRRSGYGLGWCIGSYRGFRVVHHFGSYDGSRAHLSFMPELGLGVAVVANISGPSSFFPELVASDLYDSLLGFEEDGRAATFTRQTEMRRRKGLVPLREMLAQRLGQ